MSITIPVAGSSISVAGFGSPVAGAVNQVGNTGIFSSLGGCTLSTTSATYVDITNATTSWTKVGSATASDVIVAVSLSSFSTAITTIVKVGVNISGVDTDACRFNFSVANSHTTLPTGWARFTGLGAGAYTVKLRALRVSGGGTFTIDNGDSVAFEIREDPT